MPDAMPSLYAFGDSPSPEWIEHCLSALMEINDAAHALNRSLVARAVDAEAEVKRLRAEVKRLGARPATVQLAHQAYALLSARKDLIDAGVNPGDLVIPQCPAACYPRGPWVLEKRMAEAWDEGHRLTRPHSDRCEPTCPNPYRPRELGSQGGPVSKTTEPFCCEACCAEGWECPAPCGRPCCVEPNRTQMPASVRDSCRADLARRRETDTHEMTEEIADE